MSEWRMDADRDPVYAVAADWLSRLQQRRLTLEETLAWQDWMSQEPRHRQAFAELEDCGRSLTPFRCRTRFPRRHCVRIAMTAQFR